MKKLTMNRNPACLQAWFRQDGDSGDPSYAAHWEVVKHPKGVGIAALLFIRRSLGKWLTPFGCFKACGWKSLNRLCLRLIGFACVMILTVLVGCRMVDSDDGIDDDNKTDEPKTEEPNTEKPSDSGKVYAEELWGEWLRMDTGDKWYITDDALKVNGTSAPASVVLTKQSDRVIEVTDGGRKYYLYASRTATASFTGVIVGDAGAAGSARAIGGGLGGVRVAIENLVNKANELNAVTDADGRFTANNAIPGDAYQVTPQGGTPVTVIPTSDGDDIGVVTITGGVNFKTSLIPTQSSADVTELYLNETYEFDLEFENTGNDDCRAPSYTITAPSDVSITGTLQGILGTIEKGKKKNVPIGVRCYAVADDHEYEYKKINIRIEDAAGKTWDDSVSLRFYHDTLDFNIKAEKPVSGIIISPDAKTYSFTNVTDEKVSAPRRTAGDYLVVFSGATIETETRYSLGIGIAADGDFSKLSSSAAYEKNDTEDEAVSLNEQKIMAYLDKNDIDYYRIFYGNFNIPPTPTNVTASVAEAEVTVSWSTVTEANSYNIYRADSQTGTYTKVGASTSPSYIDTVARAGTYYYKISAVVARGFESVYSTPTAVAVAGPSAPTNVAASVAEAEVTVS
jgi:hypothetical protein